MRKLLLAALLLCAFARCAFAQKHSYTYGGSGHDILYEAAVSPDGRIVLTGMTDSADGTLSTRTRTGRCGWALCIDTEGNVLWNFCTRRGSYDSLRYPVFLEDGCVAMLLDTSHSGLYEVEWILLDRDGRQIAQKTLESRGVPWIVRAGGIHDASQGSYIVDALNKKTSEHLSLLYTFDGERIGDTEYAEGTYFPDPVLLDGSRITIQNDEEPPLDVTVSFHVPSVPPASFQRLIVIPADDIDGVLLYSQPDASNAPIGKCLAGVEVIPLSPSANGWTHVCIQGYEGYMRSKHLQAP